MPIGRGDNYGHDPRPSSFRATDKLGGSNSALADLFYPILSQDVAYYETKFMGETLPADLWTTVAGTGATAFAVPATPILGGAIRAATGTDATGANRRVNLFGAPIMAGDHNCGVEVRIRLSAITSIELEVGFVDSMTNLLSSIEPVVTDPDGALTFAAGVGDAALIGLYTDETANTLLMATKGSGALNAGACDVFTITTLPTANEWAVFRMQLAGNTATAFVGANRQAQRVSAIEGGTLVRPWVYVGGVTATSRNCDIAYIRYWLDYEARQN